MAKDSLDIVEKTFAKLMGYITYQSLKEGWDASELLDNLAFNLGLYMGRKDRNNGS